MDLNQCCQYRE